MTEPKFVVKMRDGPDGGLPSERRYLTGPICPHCGLEMERGEGQAMARHAEDCRDDARDAAMTEELRAALAEATPGPWHRHTYGHRTILEIVEAIGRSLRFHPGNTDATYVHVDAPDDTGPTIAFIGNGPKQIENGRYIAAANPETIAALLAENDRLRAALAAAVDAFDPMSPDWPKQPPSSACPWCGHPPECHSGPEGKCVDLESV